MFDHVEIKTQNFEQCVAFYKAVFETLDIELKWSDSAAAGFGKVSEPNVRFLIEKAAQSQRCHLAFSASSKEEVAAFYQAAMAIDAKCNGAPGLREHYAPNYYAAFVFDPDGNNVEAVCYL